jgi:ribonuclease BN (tRNA processing enzyme)
MRVSAPKMKVAFLGTNGWYSTEAGNTSCVLIDSEEFYVVLDAGDGIYKLDEYVKTEKPIHLFLSHLHLDHIIGLHMLGKFRFKQKINIYGYTGTRDGLQIIRHPYTAPFHDLPVQVEIHDLLEGRHTLPFPFTCKLLVHADLCLGYRLELDNRIVAYCTDTGMCDNLYMLARNADLLITECSFKSGQAEWRWPHLKPMESANIAEEANAKQLVLTHFDADVYRTMKDRERARVEARRVFNNTVAAHDGLEINL